MTLEQISLVVVLIFLRLVPPTLPTNVPDVPCNPDALQVTGTTVVFDQEREKESTECRFAEVEWREEWGQMSGEEWEIQFGGNIGRALEEELDAELEERDGGSLPHSYAFGEREEERDYAESMRRAGEGRVRVVTYNVLSSSLSDAAHYHWCHPHDCDPEVRYGRLLQKLRPHIQAGALLCLQEVSRQWAERLQEFFEGKGYEWRAVQYGRSFNGFMGVAIAWPRNVLEIEEDICETLAETKVGGWPGATPPSVYQETETETPWTWLLKAARRLIPGLESAAEIAQKEREGERDWWASRVRKNAVIGGIFRAKNDHSVRFLAATYHMPCAFNTPQVMVTHGALLLQFLQRRAMEANVPLMLLGDFNFQPSSSVYRLYTTGEISDEDIPWVPPEESWTPHLQQRVGSAYVMGQGHEPDITNYAATSGNSLFAGVLDYVFLSPPQAWAVEGLLPLPHRSQLGVRSLPSAMEPSDHLLLSADVRIRSRRQRQ